MNSPVALYIGHVLFLAQDDESAKAVQDSMKKCLRLKWNMEASVYEVDTSALDLAPEIDVEEVKPGIYRHPAFLSKP